MENGNETNVVEQILLLVFRLLSLCDSDKQLFISFGLY